MAAQRRAWLARIGGEVRGPDHRHSVDTTLDSIADHLGRHMDIEGMVAILRAPED